MKTQTLTRGRRPATLLAALLLPLAAAAAEFHLIAGATTITPPGAAGPITMWGFALDPDFGGDGVVTVPGPILEMPFTDATLTIHLRNTLAEPVSLVIPGQSAVMNPVRFADAQGRLRVRSFTHETPPGQTRTYVWTDFRPGTFLYQTGTHPAVQVQMGLYGAVTKDAGPGLAYPGEPYDHELILVYSEIDPALHADVASGNYVPFGDPTTQRTSTIDYEPKFFLINGQPYENLMPALPAGSVGQRVLIRFLSASLESHAPMLLGTRMRVIAEDGSKYPHARDHYAVLLPAAKTLDVIVTPPAAGPYPLLDRRLNLTNGGGPAPGGMLRVLLVAP